MEVDDRRLSQQLGRPIFVVVLHPYRHNIGEGQTQLVVGHQLCTVCGIAELVVEMINQKLHSALSGIAPGGEDLPVNRRFGKGNTKENRTCESD